MKTVAGRIDLGLSRVAGYTVFDSDTLEFLEFTPKEVKQLITDEGVNGLTVTQTGDIVLDNRWNLNNLKVKSGVGNYRNSNTDIEKKGTVYSVVRAINLSENERVYEVINNRCARIIFKEKHLLELCQLACVGGIKIDEETKKIVICEGVIIEDHSNNYLLEIGNKVYTDHKTGESKASTKKNTNKKTVTKKIK